MDNIIEIKNLHKKFGKVNAVNNLNFTMKRGTFLSKWCR